MSEPRLVKVAKGWAAVGDGWAVIAENQHDALMEFADAERRRAEILARSDMDVLIRRAFDEGRGDLLADHFEAHVGVRPFVRSAADSR